MDTVLCCRPPLPIPIFRLTDFAAQYTTFIEKLTYIQADDTDTYTHWKCICFSIWSPPTHIHNPQDNICKMVNY